MSEVRKESLLSEDIADHIRKEVERWREYRIELERTPPFLGFDEFKKRRIEEQRQMLQSAVDRLTTSILKIAKYHMPWVNLIPDDPDLSIANILQSMPAKTNKKQVWLVSGRSGGQ